MIVHITLFHLKSNTVFQNFGCNFKFFFKNRLYVAVKCILETTLMFNIFFLIVIACVTQ